MKSRNWLAFHRRMFAFYGGVPHVTVPDCSKQGVLKCHPYDPDLNPGHAQLATDYTTAVVAARPSQPKDKAIVEGLVKIPTRYMRFRYRGRRFASVTEINAALAECVERINDRRHSRLSISRRERFEAVEKAALRPLPIGDVDCREWKEATLHAD
jgi:transposase